MMDKKNKTLGALAAAALSLTLVANASAATVKHHSKAKGAVVGAVAGHMVGGKKGAVAGAVVGAELQHHKNKKAAKRGY